MHLLSPLLVMLDFCAYRQRPSAINETRIAGIFFCPEALNLTPLNPKPSLGAGIAGPEVHPCGSDRKNFGCLGLRGLGLTGFRGLDA